jgi:sucrose-6-phosphatase
MACMIESTVLTAQPLALFITDLDHTLVGDSVALEALNTTLENLRQSQGTKIVYATGRSISSYQELAAAEQLLIPDALVTSVGTEIYLDNEQICEEWQSKLAMGWQRPEIVQIAKRFADLAAQPQSEQRPYKISYYLSEEAAIEVIPRLRQELKREGIVAEIIYSGHKDLDIIPKGSNKGASVQFLRQFWAIPAHQTVVCGDSGNDISLFSYDAEYGILVGNSHTELKLWYEINATERHYLAHNHCAQGITEGLDYFGFI